MFKTSVLVFRDRDAYVSGVRRPAKRKTNTEIYIFNHFNIIFNPARLGGAPARASRKECSTGKMQIRGIEIC